MYLHTYVLVPGRLSRDSIVHAIFQSLFGKRKVRSGPRERYGGDWDDVDDDDDEEDEDQEEEVDESWIKTGINLTLFNSKAVDFACRWSGSGMGWDGMWSDERGPSTAIPCDTADCCPPFGGDGVCRWVCAPGLAMNCDFSSPPLFLSLFLVRRRKCEARAYMYAVCFFRSLPYSGPRSFGLFFA